MCSSLTQCEIKQLITRKSNRIFKCSESDLPRLNRWYKSENLDFEIVQ